MVATKEQIEWLEYDLLEKFPHVLHGTFSRHGGNSAGHFSTLNVGEGTPDSSDAVKCNRELVRKAVGIAKIIFPHQTHGVNVARVTSKNIDQVVQADALYTTEKNVGLGIAHADCQAAIFYDPVHEAIGVAHCGWRGSAQNIYARLVDTLKRELGTQPHNLIVCVSPSLGPDHAEFKNYKHELPKDFWAFQTKPAYFDFWKISQAQLAKCGVLEKNIEFAKVCTFCHTEDYFSYRAEKNTGRNATVVALKP